MVSAEPNALGLSSRPRQKETSSAKVLEARVASSWPALGPPVSTFLSICLMRHWLVRNIMRASPSLSPKREYCVRARSASVAAFSGELMESHTSATNSMARAWPRRSGASMYRACASRAAATDLSKDFCFKYTRAVAMSAPASPRRSPRSWQSARSSSASSNSSSPPTSGRGSLSKQLFQKFLMCDSLDARKFLSLSGWGAIGKKP
mmetsp:Transcript_45220/g.96602  ORF Transcript_45220/g.96602 Transcript_45220/m.96602 type:complete len:206 (+) Transcript_45220:503-1120(+)